MAFYHKRADFWRPNFGFKRSLLSILKSLNNYHNETAAPVSIMLFELKSSSMSFLISSTSAVIYFVAENLKVLLLFEILE